MKYRLIRAMCALIPFKVLRKKTRNYLMYVVWQRELSSLCYHSKEFKGPFQILDHHLGEVTLFCMTSQYWYKGGTLILTKDYHKHLVNMFMPNVSYLVCPRNTQGSLKNKIFERNGVLFEELLTTDELDSMNKNGKKFLENWTNYLGVHLEDSRLATPLISEDTKRNAEKKIFNLGLDLNNLIFVADEARSVLSITSDFWEKIICAASHKGYSVYLNKSAGNVVKKLTIEEAFYVASRSKMIIGLRSGLMDLLCMLNKPMAVIYTNNATTGDIQPTYTLFQYPYCSEFLCEYNLNIEPEENIIESLIMQIDSIM